jgi:phosphatidylglycerol:prolipoprotein diacylglycerol transferase
MHPILLKLGPLTLYSYGLMVALGFLAGILLATYLTRQAKLKPEVILDIAPFVLVGSIAGARIFYVVEFWRDFRGNPLEIFFIWKGGLVFYGGLLFAILGLLLAVKIFKLDLLKIMDILAPSTALGYAIGRIGCFLNGCCYGVETKVPWAVRFPTESVLRHPTQIYASISGLLICAILLLMLFKFKKFDGQVLTAGLALYAAYRFLIEFIRTNPRYLLNLTEAQWASIFLVILAGGLYIKLRRR